MNRSLLPRIKSSPTFKALTMLFVFAAFFRIALKSLERGLKLALFAAGMSVLSAHAGTATTTALFVSDSTAYTGQSITFTAKVTGSNPSGTVTFKDGILPLGTAPVSGGQAVFTTDFSLIGLHVITATYGGDSVNNGSSSGWLYVNVALKNLTLTTLSTSVNPGLVNQPITLTANVTGSSPSGTVSFKNGNTTLGTGAVVSGKATLATAFDSSGTYYLTASYEGDVANSSSSSLAMGETITLATTTTTLASASNPAYVGQLVTLTASVSGNRPSGVVTFTDGTNTLGAGNIGADGKATLTTGFSASGAHSLKAVYGGDSANKSSTSAAFSETVNAKTSTSTALASNINPASVDQLVTLTATVSGTSPSGTVTFKDGATSLAVVPVSAGKATLPTRFASTGSHTLTAVYSGDVGNNASTSAPLSETVNLNSTTTVLTSSLNPAYANQSVTLTATVTGSNATGTVTFKDGSISLGTVTVSSGTAALVTSFASAGTHNLVSVYGGDAANATSTSAILNQAINAKAITTTTLASSSNPSTIAQSITITATVSGSSPSGTVVFSDGGNTLGSATISAGKAIFNTSFPAPGNHSITAAYEGDNSNAASTSPALTQTVSLTASTVTLTSSNNPSTVGQNVSLTAVVVGSSPSGTVTFMDGANALGTGTINAGQATLVTSFAATGNHSVIAVYGGDASNASSTSAALTQTVNLNASSVTLTSSSNPSTVTQSVTLTAAVTGSSPNGAVTFMDGATVLGTGTISAGQATLATSFTATGGHSLTAVYGGDASNASSTSSALTQTVNLNTSTITLTSSSLSSTVGQSVTLTAAVAGSSPSGTVTFMDGTTALGTGTISAGQATLATSFTATGSHSLTAVYEGDAGNAPSTSPALTQTVNLNTSTVTLTSSGNPSTVAQSVTLTAAVTGSSPSGTVTFMDGATALGTGTITAGQATLTTSFTATGSHNLTAVYGGDASNASSTSSALTQTVNLNASSVTLTSSSNPSTVAQSVTLTAAVIGSSPSGTMTFMDGATALGTGTISAGQVTLTTSFTSTGSHSLTAVYGGDASNASSTSAALTQTVNLNTSTVTLTTSSNPSTVAQSVTLTAAVTGSSPSGTVTFMDGAIVLETGTITAGQATLATSFAATGSHSLTAVYGGDASNAPSTSSALTQTLNLNDSTVTLASSSNPATAGQSVTLTASVSGSSPSGTVTFMDGSSTLGTGTISAGQAALVTSFAASGSHSLTATYNGDASNAPSTSSVLSQTVNANTSTTSLTSSANPAALAQAVVLTATVSGNAPSGSVSFLDSGVSLGSATLVNGQAMLTTSFTTAGAHSITASYAGDANNAPSSSPLLTEAVNASASTTSMVATGTSVLVGQSVTLTVSVAGNSPTGTVTISDAGASLGTVNLTAGQVTVMTNFGTAGSHPLTAAYSGDSNNSASTSSVVTIQVATDELTAPAPGAMTWLYEYDAMGSRTKVVDPNGNETLSAYDSLSRPYSLALPIEYAGAPRSFVSMTLDGGDRQTKITDPRGLATSYTFDGLGNTTAQSSPDTGGAAATFDAAGNMLTKTDARGKTFTYTYDTLNRLTSVSYASGAGTLFEYDGGANPIPTALGHLTKITDESGSTSYTYDAFGRMLTKTQQVTTSGNPATLQVAYTWGNAGASMGKLIGITYPSGMKVNYGYDTQGRVNTLSVDPVNANGVGTSSGSTVSVLTGVSYTGANDVRGWTWGNGSAYQRGYDAFGRINSYQLGNPAGPGAAAGLTRTIAYDNAGRIIGYSHANALGAQPQFDQAFAYDGRDRLISTALSATSYGYTYDSNGNRTSQVIAGSSYANTVDPNSNRLTQVQVASGNGVVAVSQTYDASGNLIDNGSGAVSNYSDRGRLTGVTVAGGSVSYLYNGLEQRVVKTGPTSLVNQGAIYYAYDESGHLMGEYDANLVPIYETAYLGDLPVAAIKQDRSTAVVQTSVANVYTDHVGAPRVITRRSDNMVLWRWDQAEAFGSTPPDSNPSGVGTYAFNQRFPGQIYDTETYTFYNWHRNYQPLTGRYLQSDPIGLDGGLNTYAYVGGSPVGATDPEGLWINIVGGGLIGGVGNLSYQLYQNGGNLRCVDLGDVAKWATAGALAGALVPEGLLARAGMQTVSRWGPSGEWVMTGSSSARNWILSGSPGRYAIGDAVTTQVPTSSLVWPAAEGSGLGYRLAAAVKGLIGQRVLVGGATIGGAGAANASTSDSSCGCKK